MLPIPFLKITRYIYIYIYIYITAIFSLVYLNSDVAKSRLQQWFIYSNNEWSWIIFTPNILLALLLLPDSAVTQLIAYIMTCHLLLLPRIAIIRK